MTLPRYPSMGDDFATQSQTWSSCQSLCTQTKFTSSNGKAEIPIISSVQHKERERNSFLSLLCLFLFVLQREACVALEKRCVDGWRRFDFAADQRLQCTIAIEWKTTGKPKRPRLASHELSLEEYLCS